MSATSVDFPDRDRTSPCDCGRPGCEGLKRWQIDPFMAEVHEKTEWVFMCDGAAQARREDI